MSKDKYLSIFSPQMEAIVFIILQIVFATRAVLKIGEYMNNSLHSARKYAKNVYSRTLSVPRSPQFSSSYALGKLFATRNG